MAIATAEVDPVAEQLADALPDLNHPSGKRVWLTGLSGDQMRRTRLTCSEAIITWLRKRSTDRHRCILCGVAEGEVQRANQSAAEAWEKADELSNQLRATGSTVSGAR